MNTIYVKCNTQGVIPYSFIGPLEELEFVLLDEHDITLARYQIDCSTDIKYIEYKSDRSRIVFNQTPKMKYEITPSNNK